MVNAKTKALEAARYPGMEREYVRAIQEVIDRKGIFANFNYDGERVFRCWISNKSEKDFMEAEKADAVNREAEMREKVGGSDTDFG